MLWGDGRFSIFFHDITESKQAGERGERVHGVETYPGTGIGLAIGHKGTHGRRSGCGIDAWQRQPVLGKVR
ncbi:MAG: hypothetical protein ACYCTW_09560 [Sulfuricella sp.]